MLIKKGYTFKSETDTEVVAQLFEDLYDGDMVSTTRKLLEKIRGAYALGIMCTDHPDTLVAVRKDCPLLLVWVRAKTISHPIFPPCWNTPEIIIYWKQMKLPC